MARNKVHPPAPPAVNDSWLTNCTKAVSIWKGKTVTYIKGSEAYKLIDRNLIGPFLTLKSNHPVVHAVALATLSVLSVILCFNLAFSSFKRAIFAIVPIAIIALYFQNLLYVSDNVSNAWKAYQTAYPNPRS